MIDVTKLAPSRLTHDEARAVIVAVEKLGYAFDGTGGGELSDEDKRLLFNHLADTTPLRALNFPEIMAFFTSIAHAGHVIRKPLKHPSGLDTTEAPFTRVVPIDSPFQRNGSPIVGAHGEPYRKHK